METKLNPEEAAVEEQPADSELETSEETEEPEGAEPSDEDVVKPRGKSAYQRRIDELTREKYELRAERDAWRARADRVEGQVKPEVITPAPSTGQPPRLDDFEDTEQFSKAVAEYAAKVVADQTRIAQRQETEREKAGRRMSALNTAAQQSPEMAAILADTTLPPLPPDMAEAADGDLFAEIVHYLGKNKGEYFRILDLPSAQRMKEIGKIEMRLSQNPQPKTRSKAPTPIESTIGGGGKPGAKPPEKMSYKELDQLWTKKRLKDAGVT